MGGEENLTKHTPPKEGFWTPHLFGLFFTQSLLCFPVPVSKTEQTGSSLGGGPEMLQEGAFSGAYSSPHMFFNTPKE